MEVLARKESNLIHASSTFPTLYSIVEELIFNSLDAKANKIEIGINKTTFEIYIRDNGHGISSQLLYAGLGQVEYTTKDRNNVTCYGYRGESLKLLSALSSDVIIISRYKESNHTYQKIITNTVSQSINLLPNYIWPTTSNTNTNSTSNNNNLSTTSSSSSCSGTIIRLINLYQNLPVRRISLHINQEINKIKQLIYKLSILHHKISFQFYSTHSHQKGQNYKSYINLYTQVSVTARFKELHNIDIIRDVVVSYNYTYYTIIFILFILYTIHTLSIYVLY